MTFQPEPAGTEVNSSNDAEVVGRRRAVRGCTDAPHAAGGLLTLRLSRSRASVTPWTIREDETGRRVLDVGYPTIHLVAQ